MPGTGAALALSVASPGLTAAVLSCALAFVVSAHAQNSSQSAIIDQSRLYDRTPSSRPAAVTADGTALPSNEDQSSDDSFGVQQVLKANEQQPHWFVGANQSLFFTNNAALTRRDTVSDGLSVTDMAAGWMSTLQPGLQIQAALHASIFRYFDTSALDFENLGASVGAAWAPREWSGLALFSHYDFIELLDKHSREILSEHDWTIGVQKPFVFGRAHSLTVGILGMVGTSDPFSEQRDQLGGFASYHVQLARKFEVNLSYSLNGYFYNKGDRKDLNQIISSAAIYHFNQWASVAAFISFADNRSNHAPFDYDVFTTGGGVGLNVRF